jgi:hypothetical protein
MSHKPSCNLCGATLVEEDCAVICGRCAWPLDDRQKEIDGLAKEKDELEDELAALRAENERLERALRQLAVAILMAQRTGCVSDANSEPPPSPPSRRAQGK